MTAAFTAAALYPDTVGVEVATIDDYLEAARSRLDRVHPANLDTEVEKGALLIDIRPEADRDAYGTMPGAIVIDRNVLEWRLAPSSEARTIDLDEGQRVILFCNDSYQSSLSAAVLQDLEIKSATDLVGGFNAYQAHRDKA